MVKFTNKPPSNLKAFLNNPRRFIFGRYRRNPIIRYFAKEAYKTLMAYINSDYHMDRNGEAWVQTLLSNHNLVPPQAIFIDCGANVGEWSLFSLNTHQDIQLHAFEIVADTRKALEHNLTLFPQVKIPAYGLSNVTGSANVNYQSDLSSTASINYLGDDIHQIQACQIITGQDYCKLHNINEIFFLKIDTEGHDLFVLQGFEALLAQQKIDIIQFEYNLFSVYSKTFLNDFYTLLDKYGYTTGKLYPNYVGFKSYDVKDDDFHVSNYISISPNNPELITLLGA